MGGGPYRPGSGIQPPSLLREVKPVYTDDARRRNITGDVLLEIVVRYNGQVGEVRIETLRKLARALTVNPLELFRIAVGPDGRGDRPGGQRPD